MKSRKEGEGIAVVVFSVGREGSAVLALAGHHTFSTPGYPSCNPFFDSSA